MGIYTLGMYKNFFSSFLSPFGTDSLHLFFSNSFWTIYNSLLNNLHVDPWVSLLFNLKFSKNIHFSQNLFPKYFIEYALVITTLWVIVFDTMWF